MKPRLTLREQFTIPAPYRIWCHLCSKGFMTFKESSEHDRENLNLHRKIQQERENAGQYLR